MSRRLLRLCCLCLLVLALPLQGLAAVTWLHGSPGHGPVARVTQVTQATQAAHAARPGPGTPAPADDETPPCHGHAAATGHGADGQAGAAADADADADAAQHAGCSACASCCGHGSAPPAVWPAAPQPASLGDAPAAVAGPRIAPWTAGGIERPPRR